MFSTFVFSLQPFRFVIVSDTVTQTRTKSSLPLHSLVDVQCSALKLDSMFRFAQLISLDSSLFFHQVPSSWHSIARDNTSNARIVLFGPRHLYLMCFHFASSFRELYYVSFPYGYWLVYRMHVSDQPIRVVFCL